MAARWLALASRWNAFLACWCVAALFSCKKHGEAVDDGASRGEVEAAVTPATSIAAPNASLEPRAADAGGLVPATRRSCRVMALRGTATTFPRFPGAPGQDERRSLVRGDLVPEGGLIELGADSELTVHATVSTREITLIGPARCEACPGGDEAVRLSYGRATAFPGSGVRPGADVWIATPLGVVRFSDANIEVAVPELDAARLEVGVTTGRATFVPAPGVSAVAPGAAHTDAAGPAPAGAKDGAAVGTLTAGEAVALGPGTAFAARRRTAPSARWAAEMVAACVQRAAAARQAGELVAAPRDAGLGSPADLAFAHVAARQKARAACETAWAAGALAPGLIDAARRSELERADATWKGVPAR